MATAISTDDVETAARALLDGKVAAVRDLAHARQLRNDKRAELDDAERADATAYAAAERAGWTADELRKVGLDAPNRKAPGRPRRARQPQPDSAPSADASGA